MTTRIAPITQPAGAISDERPPTLRPRVLRHPPEMPGTGGSRHLVRPSSDEPVTGRAQSRPVVELAQLVLELGRGAVDAHAGCDVVHREHPDRTVR